MNRHENALQILHTGTAIPATPLALNDDGTFNEKTQRLLMRYYLAAGSGGIATAVHSTQFAIRDPKIGLFEPVLRVVAEEITEHEKRTGKTIVRVAGACGAVGQAVKEAELLRSLGYDAVLLSPGGLGTLTEAELLTRTKEVAKVLPVIGFYLQPAVGGRVFTYDYWQRLCDIDGVAAIKCASFNRYSTAQVVRAATYSDRADKIALYTGNDDNIVIDLLTTYHFNENNDKRQRRFDGGLLGHWSVWTKKAVDLLAQAKQIREKDAIPAEWLTLAAQITDMNSAVFDTAHNFAGCIAGLHEVLRRQGLMQSIRCIDPAETLSAGQAEEITRVCNAYPDLTDDAFIAENIGAWKKL